METFWEHALCEFKHYFWNKPHWKYFQRQFNYNQIFNWQARLSKIVSYLQMRISILLEIPQSPMWIWNISDKDWSLQCKLRALGFPTYIPSSSVSVSQEHVLLAWILLPICWLWDLLVNQRLYNKCIIYSHSYDLISQD